MENVEDIYPLTPMQEVMLLHAVSRRGGDTLFSQFCFELSGPLDSDRFQAAWCVLTKRHAALRTMFVWTDLKRPVQVVLSTVDPSFAQLDWRSVSEDQRASRFTAFCEEDKSAGFDPTQAPLLRMSLIILEPNRHLFVWSSHHLIFDRWCITTLFEELAALMSAPDLDGGRATLPPPAPFSDYVRWIQQQDPVVTREFWRQQLRGFATPSLLTSRKSVAAPEGEEQLADLEISAATTGELKTIAKQLGVTFGVVVQFALALLVNRVTGNQDIVFGVAVSGRPVDLPDAESIVGSFVTNVPARVRLGSDHCVGEIVKRMQLEQQQRMRHEYLAPTDIQAVASFSDNRALFDTIVVSLAGKVDMQLPGISVDDMPGELNTAYPLTLGLEEQGGSRRITARLHRDYESLVPLQELLVSLGQTLRATGQLDPAVRLEQLPEFRGSLQADSWQDDEGESAKGLMTDPVASQDPSGTGRERLEPALMEELLREEWCSVLKVGGVDANADFFDVGGDSLSAVALHGRIEIATRQQVPLVALFQSSTIKAMTEFLVAGNWPLRPGITTTLRSSGSRLPLFCVASPEVNTLGYTLLARHLSKDWPVYVLQAPPDTDDIDRLSPRIIPDLAKRYVEALLSVQTSGPYNILGMCTGSHIAVELARQLERSGEHVAFLGIINTWAHFTVSKIYHLERWRNRLGWYFVRIRELLRTDARGLVKLVARKLRSRRVPAPVPEYREADGSSSIETQEIGADWIDDFGWADLFDPALLEPVAVPIIVYRTHRQQYWRVTDSGLGWGRFTSGGAQIVDLTTRDHDDVLREPDVRVFAGLLQSDLESYARQSNFGDVREVVPA